MDRRTLGALVAATATGAMAMRPAWARSPARDLDRRLQRFRAFPDATSFRIDVGHDEIAADSAATQRFVASAIKTFITC